LKKKVQQAEFLRIARSSARRQSNAPNAKVLPWQMESPFFERPQPRLKRANITALVSEMQRVFLQLIYK
jgi:hypothetical protein